MEPSFGTLLKFRLPVAAVVACCAAVSLILIGYALLLIAPVNPSGPDTATAAQFIFGPSPLHPKPRDRFMFVALTIALLGVIGGAVALSRRLRLKIDDPVSLFYLSTVATFCIFLWEGTIFPISIDFLNRVQIEIATCFFIPFTILCRPIVNERLLKIVFFFNAVVYRNHCRLLF